MRAQTTIILSIAGLALAAATTLQAQESRPAPARYTADGASHTFKSALAFAEDGFVHVILSEEPLDPAVVKALTLDSRGFVELAKQGEDGELEFNWDEGGALLKRARVVERGKACAMLCVGPFAALKSGAKPVYAKLDGPPNKDDEQMAKLTAAGGWIAVAAVSGQDVEEAAPKKAYKAKAPWRLCESAKASVTIEAAGALEHMVLSVDASFEGGARLDARVPVLLQAELSPSGRRRLEGFSAYPYKD